MDAKSNCKTMVAVCVFVMAVATVSCLPVDVQPHNANSQQSAMSQTQMRTSMRLIGDATNFLRSWFQRLRANIEALRSSEHPNEPKHRITRSLGTGDDGNTDHPAIKVNEMSSNESSFESYEKKFLINQTLSYLKQIYYYSQYRQKQRENNNNGQSSTSAPDPIETPNNTNRVNELLSAKMNELNSLSLSQLEKIFHNVRRAARDGVEDPGITSVCCPQG